MIQKRNSLDRFFAFYRHDYSWYYLLYITQKGSNNSYLQSFKKKYVSSEIIGYF